MGGRIKRIFAIVLGAGAVLSAYASSALADHGTLRDPYNADNTAPAPSTTANIRLILPPIEVLHASRGCITDIRVLRA